MSLMAHRSGENNRPSSAEGVKRLSDLAATDASVLPALGVAVMATAARFIESLDLGAHSGMAGSHACVGDVLIVVTLPNYGQSESRWCLACLEDADPVDALSRLLPGCGVSVRAGV